jgi:hypothetical protein
MSRTACKLVAAWALALLLTIPAASATWEAWQKVGLVQGAITVARDANSNSLIAVWVHAKPKPGGVDDPTEFVPFPTFTLYPPIQSANNFHLKYVASGKDAPYGDWSVRQDETPVVKAAASPGTVVQSISFGVKSLDFVFLLQGVKGDGSSFTYPLTGRFQLKPTGTLLEASDETADGIRTQTFIGGFNLNAEVIPDASTVTLFASGLLPMVALLRRRKA